MTGLLQDFRYAVRMVSKSPGFAIVAVLTLALGVGANTLIFSVVDAVLLKPLPYPESDRLVMVHESLPGAPSLNVSWPDFVSWKEQNRAFENLAAFRPERLNFSAGPEPNPVNAGWVSPSFFSMLGAKTVLGRALVDNDDKPSAAPAVVLSYSFWRNTLSGDPNVIGRTLSINNSAVVVAGVLSPDFRWSPKSDVYLPIGLLSSQQFFTARANHPGIQAIGKLRPGISLKAGQADLDNIMGRLALAFPESNRNEKAPIVTLSTWFSGDLRVELMTLLAAVGLVLLLACANVAHLSLTRTTVRRREFAIRAALGANRLRLMRQLLIESLLLSVLGGGLGWLAASQSLLPLLRLYPGTLSRLNQIQLDSRVLCFTLGVCLIAALLSGLAPMLEVVSRRTNESLKESSLAATGGKTQRKFRSALLIGEIAVALVVAVGAGLLVRSFVAALRVDCGFQPDHLLALDVVRSVPDPLAAQDFMSQARERVSQLPGVRSASAAMCAPLMGTCWTSPYGQTDRPLPPATERPWTALNMVMPGYFETLQTPLLEGRIFSDLDNANSEPVAIINQTMAHRLSVLGRAEGKQVYVQYASHNILRVVGVVADIKQFGVDNPAGPEVFVPASQMPVKFMTLVVRTSGDPGELAHPAALSIQGLDKNQPIARVTPMTAAIEGSVSPRKFAALLVSVFGVLAVVLAAVGVSGVMAYSVAQRTHEFGIRLALGARRGQVVRLVLQQTAWTVAIGLAVGFATAWWLSRLLGNLVFGVTLHDPLTFAVTTMCIVAVAFGACFVPIARAAKVDPMVALRYE